MTSSQPASPAAGSVAGLVLAGGRSTRFGGEKAAALLGGRPLLLWAARRLQPSCSGLAASVRRGSAAEALALANGLPALYDAEGDAAGPLTGVKAGLIWAAGIGAQSLAVSPCDAPLLPEDLFVRLIGAAGLGAAMARTAQGRQPLCAVWPIGALATVSAALAGGAHPAAWRVLESLGAAVVDFGTPEAFANLNTRGDLAAVQATLSEQR